MFKQHVPNYVDVKQKLTSDASTTEEVLAISWVNSWTESTEHTFDMWTCSSRTLIAVYDGGTYWWVVGYADFDLHLPDFSDNHIAKPIPVVVISDEIVVKGDGRAWYVLRGSGSGYVGYRVDTQQWLDRRYTAFQSESEAESVKEKLLGVINEA